MLRWAFGRVCSCQYQKCKILVNMLVSRHFVPSWHLLSLPSSRHFCCEDAADKWYIPTLRAWSLHSATEKNPQRIWHVLNRIISSASILTLRKICVSQRSYGLVVCGGCTGLITVTSSASRKLINRSFDYRLQGDILWFCHREVYLPCISEARQRASEGCYPWHGYPR